jgi:2-polyprenyl-3-methyl-5-hydroxy-6-metoxy-1,4-benzoquinol methylase
MILVGRAMDENKKYTSANRAAWDASAPLHEAGETWQRLLAEVAKADFSTFDETLRETLEDVGVVGKRVVQVCCNNGREVLSLSAMGAKTVLGIDQSDAFLAQARKLAHLSGRKCDFLCADIYELPQDTPGDFDLGLITIGVLNWMPDLKRFFDAVSGLLARDGVLVIYETHPFLEMFDPTSADPFSPSQSYFDRGPHANEDTITYDGSDGGQGPVSWWFSHTMGEIVSAAVAAGLKLERFNEYPHSNRETEFDIYEDRKVQIPMCYTLVLRKER